MNTHRGDSPNRHRSRSPVVVDLPGVLALLLIGVFLLIFATVAYGFATGTLRPELVLAAGSTLFTGILGGALAARRVAHGEPSSDTEEKSRDGGDSP